MTRIPDFFIVGAPKCGTTSMYEYLRVHPDIFMPGTKEPHYFGSDLDIRAEPRSREEYLALFDEGASHKRAGESSVLYLFSKNAAREIHTFNPHARIVIMLREPVSAMLSWHGQLVSMMIEDIYDFEEAVRAQEARRRGERLPEAPRLRSGLQYEAVFSYAEQVERYFNEFNRAQVHIALLDDMIRDVAGTYRRVLEFLEVDPAFAPDFAVHNEKKWARSPAVSRFFRRNRGLRKLAKRLAPKAARQWTTSALEKVLPAPERPPIRPEFLSVLRARCRPDVERLSELIGRDLSDWLSSSPRK